MAKKNRISKKGGAEQDTSIEVLRYENRGTRDVLFAAGLVDKVAEWMVLVGPVEMLMSCPSLTLTISSLERSLFNYIQLLFHHAMGSSSNVRNAPQTLKGIADALARELPKMEQDPILKKKFPKPIGGICSLLYFLTVTLEATITTLEELAYLNSITPGEELKPSRTDTRQPVDNSNWLRVSSVFGLSVGGAGAWVLKGGSGVELKGSSRSIVTAGCVAGAWVGSVSIIKIVLKERRKRKARAALINCNYSLSTILKLLILVLNIVDVETVRRNTSYHTLFLDPSEDDHKTKTTSRTLLEVCPLPSVTSFWYVDAELSVFLFRRVMDSLYAATSQTETLYKLGGPLLAAPVMVMLGLYYGIINPQAASLRACIEMQSPSVEFIRRAWGVLNSDLIVAASQAIGYLQGMRYQRNVVINGVFCRVYAKQAPCIGEEANVVFFCHGGAFVASLHAADIPLLTTWAETGAVIIVPDYSLSPENPYPVALNEVLDVYLALNNKRSCQYWSVEQCPDLDWLPPINRLVLTGESAGGTLAAALTVRILQLQDECAEEDENYVEGVERGTSAKGQVYLPDGLVLIYPALNFSLAPSPSRAVLNFDPVMPLGIMYLVMRVYTGEEFNSTNAHTECCLSPYHTPDFFMRRFPATCLIAGGFDPLLDDAVDFDTRLRRVGVKSSLHVEPALPHGFIGLIHTSKSAARAISKGTDFIVSVFNQKLEP